jgi:hypothetical protein
MLLLRSVTQKHGMAKGNRRHHRNGVNGVKSAMKYQRHRSEMAWRKRNENGGVSKHRAKMKKAAAAMKMAKAAS